MIRLRPGAATAGFTLLEAMLAVALMAAIVGALATVTAQWLPNWRRGFASLQRADTLGLGMERMVADIAMAEFVTINGVVPQPLFEGGEVSLVFVRPAYSPDSPPHLEVVRLAEIHDERGFAMVRTRAPYFPLAPGLSANRYVFTDPVVLARTPFRVSFAYAGPARNWLNSWNANAGMPSAVRVTVRDQASNQVLAASTAVAMKLTASGIPKSTSVPGAPVVGSGETPTGTGPVQ